VGAFFLGIAALIVLGTIAALFFEVRRLIALLF
jgi:hypothetical protein